MRTTLVAATALALVLAASAIRAEEATAAPGGTTVTGEVIDLACYAEKGARGIEHADCAQSCIAKGMPIGLLTGDGKMYVLIGSGHEALNKTLAPQAGKQVTAVGTVHDASGVSVLTVSHWKPVAKS